MKNTRWKLTRRNSCSKASCSKKHSSKGCLRPWPNLSIKTPLFTRSLGRGTASMASRMPARMVLKARWISSSSMPRSRISSVRQISERRKASLSKILLQVYRSTVSAIFVVPSKYPTTANPNFLSWTKRIESGSLADSAPPFLTVAIAYNQRTSKEKYDIIWSPSSIAYKDYQEKMNSSVAGKKVPWDISLTTTFSKPIIDHYCLILASIITYQSI